VSLAKVGPDTTKPRSFGVCGGMGRLRFELRTSRLKAECSTAELATRAVRRFRNGYYNNIVTPEFDKYIFAMPPAIPRDRAIRRPIERDRTTNLGGLRRIRSVNAVKPYAEWRTLGYERLEHGCFYGDVWIMLVVMRGMY
jgi:hypothetical protein